MLYVALRGEVTAALGLEVGERRHIQAEEACARLRKEVELQDRQEQNLTAGNIEAPLKLPRLQARVAEFSVALGDCRKFLYADATVVAFCNLCMDNNVQNRTLENLMRCPGLRRVVTAVSLPPHTRLSLVRNVHVSCTWAKISAWHVYDVLPAAPPRIRNPSTLIVSSSHPRIAAKLARPLPGGAGGYAMKAKDLEGEEELVAGGPMLPRLRSIRNGLEPRGLSVPGRPKVVRR